MEAVVAGYYQLLKRATRLEAITLVVARLHLKAERHDFLQHIDDLTDDAVRLLAARKLAEHSPTLQEIPALEVDEVDIEVDVVFDEEPVSAAPISPEPRSPIVQLHWKPTLAETTKVPAQPVTKPALVVEASTLKELST